MYGDLVEAESEQGLVQSFVRLFRRSKPCDEIELRSSLGPSNVASNAVVVKSAYKSYGALKVLDDFNMTVPKGTIYGLLGASGCGKTTLLNCINGMKGLNYGDIYVLGGKVPETKNEGKIGYMPQGTALYADLTAEETFFFFGRVMGMDEGRIMEKETELIGLLMIPQGSKEVKEMSGGEQRRLSLAVALLHEPELLILDEPTVGADALLRCLIWDHFLNLTRKGGVTIIITTHYIEEAIQATLVGLMRGGCLMAENSPSELLRLHRSSTLEKVFLDLSVIQNQNLTVSKPSQPLKRTAKIKESFSMRRTHMKALSLKNSLWFRKNWATTITTVALPLFMITAFCVAIGHRPIDLRIAIVNYEVGLEGCWSQDALDYRRDRLSCSFLTYLSHRKIKLQFYPTEFESLRSVKSGESHAAITIKANYSEALRARVYDWYGASTNEVEVSTIDVVRDLSDKHLSIYIQIMLYEVLQEYVDAFLDSCGINKDAAKIPIKWERVYDWLDFDFTNFCMPGFLLTVIFVTALLLTAFTWQIEQNSTVVERLLAIGVTKTELMISHIVVDAIILIFQVATSMALAFLVFKMTIKGSILLAAMLLLFTGFFGTCYGMFISCLTDSQMGITLMGVGSCFVTVFTNGIIWPVEGGHRLLKPIAEILPLTKPTESMRNIMHRNWDITRPDVYFGFFTVAFWTVLSLLSTFVIVKFKRY